MLLKFLQFGQKVAYVHFVYPAILNVVAHNLRKLSMKASGFIFSVLKFLP